jgi:hypothetical protein
MTQVTVTGKYSSVTDQSKLQSEAVSGRVQGFIGKNQLAVEYAGSADPKNNSAVSRSFSFISDRNEKLPLRFDVLYKARNINRSDIQLVRLYNVRWRIDRASDVTYTYSSLPEAANQVMQLVRSSGFTLARTLTPSLRFSQNYSTNFNLNQNVKTNRFVSAITGRVDRLSAMELGYLVDVNTANGANTNAHSIRLSFDRQLATDRYFAINALYTMDNVSDLNDTRVNFDFKSRF